MSGLRVIPARIAPFASRKCGLLPQSGSSVLDCPEQNHTSPTRTSFADATAPPDSAESVRPSQQAPIAPSFTHHLPSAPAVASRVIPANDTFTFAPGSAVPHTGTSRPRWRTAPSANGTPRSTFASREKEHSAAAAARPSMVFFMPAIIPHRHLYANPRFPFPVVPAVPVVSVVPAVTAV